MPRALLNTKVTEIYESALSNEHPLAKSSFAEDDKVMVRESVTKLTGALKSSNARYTCAHTDFAAQLFLIS